MILHNQRQSEEERSSSKSKSKKKSKQRLSTKLEIRVPDYDVEVFTGLISFLHCGRVSVKPNTVAGKLVNSL